MNAIVSGDHVLQAGHYFRRDGCLFQIVAWDPAHPLDVEACVVESGVNQHFTIMDLFAPEPITQFGPFCTLPQKLAANIRADLFQLSSQLAIKMVDSQ